MHGTDKQGAQIRRVVSAQVSPADAARLEELARAGDRSLSGEIRRAIREHLRGERPGAAR